jgi:DNA-directed RNA polymerase subunit RPC12/RpoP
MKLINYRCKKCYKQQEEYFTSEELLEAPETIKCPSCGGKMKQFNFTNNNTIQKFDWNKE